MKAINSYTIRITGILVLTLLRFGFSSSDALVAEQAAPAKIYLFNLLFAFITSAIMWEANRWLVVYFNKTSPYSKTGNKHFVKEIISVIILNAVIYVLYILVMMLIDPASRPHFVFLLYG